MAGRKITIEFLGNSKSAINAADQVEGRYGRLGGKLQKVGKQAGKMLAGGLLLGGAALVKLGRGAAEDETAAKNLANTLRNTAGATKGQVAQTESWITAQGKALGIADDQLRPALNRLAVATGSVAKAQKLTSLAMDISQGSGKSLESVTTALAKAQNGNLAGLGRLGVKTKDAAGKTLTLQQVTKNLADTYKGAASKAADTTEGKQRRLQVTLSEMGETIGYKVLPAMLKLVDIGSKAADWASKHAKLVGAVAGALVGLVALTWAVGAAMSAWSAAVTLWTGIQKVATGLQWAWNAAMDANPIGLIVLALVGLGVLFVVLYKKSDKFRAIVQGAFRAVQKAASAVWNWIKSTWPKLGTILAAPFKWAWSGISAAYSKIKAGVTNAVRWVKDKFGDLVGFVKGLPGKIGHAASGMFNGIKNAFRSAINWIIDKWNGLSFGIPAVKVAGKTIFPGAHFNTPNIPRLAKGGIVPATPGGRLILAGEGGHDEAVIPLRKGRRGVGGGDVHYHITVNGALDPVAVRKQIHTLLLQEKRISNTPLGLA